MPGRVFVGQRDEPFAVNLGRVFDLVNIVPVDGTAFPGGIMQDPANDIIADKNITTLALELPAKCITAAARRRDRRMDDGVAAQDARRERADGRRQARDRHRAVGAGLAPLESARQRSRHRPARQGRLQRQRAAQGCAVRDLRDEPDAAGAARRAVPRRRQRDARDEHPEPRAVEPAAARPGDGLPDRLQGRQPAGQGDGLRDGAPQHRHRGDAGRDSKARSALPAATSPASRTAAGRATTSSTSRCGS